MFKLIILVLMAVIAYAVAGDTLLSMLNYFISLSNQIWNALTGRGLTFFVCIVLLTLVELITCGLEP